MPSFWFKFSIRSSLCASSLRRYSLAPVLLILLVLLPVLPVQAENSLGIAAADESALSGNGSEQESAAIPGENPATGDELPLQQPTAAAEKNSPKPKQAAPSTRKLANTGEVSLTADQVDYDMAKGLCRAQGDVLVKSDGMTLRADRLQYGLNTQDAEASGDVRLDSPQGYMQGERLDVNMGTGLGAVYQGRAFLREQNFHLTGTEIERIGETEYRISDGTFTTCEGENPSWKFSAKELEVTKGGYARAKHVVFRLGNVPVFYLPYLVYPAKTERESGFLMPRYGYSQKRGVQLSLAYYQVIDRNQDATFYLDYLSELGLGKGVEYRYVFGTQHAGEATIYHVSGFNNNRDRYAYAWKHLGWLPNQVRVGADMEYVSSKDYFDDFGEVASEYNQETVESVLFMSRHFGRSDLTGQFKYIKDLEVEDNSQTLQRLPEVRYTLIRHRLLETPFYYRLDSSANYFWRREGNDGTRMILHPSLTWVAHPGNWLEFTSEVGYQERFYQTSEENANYGDIDFVAKLSTLLSRIYTPDRPVLKKLRHSIEPELSYRYVPGDATGEELWFDSLDRQEDENLLALALTNRLTARLEPEQGAAYYHDYLYWRLAEEYDIHEERRDEVTDETPRRPFGTIRNEVIVRPTRYSYLDIDSRFDPNPENRGFSMFNLTAGYRDAAENRLQLEYRYQENEQDYLDGRIETSLLKPVYVTLQERYDFNDQTNLEQVVMFEYRAQCWSLFLTYRDRLNDKEYLVSFALGGLGKVNKVGGSLASDQAD